MTEKLERTAVIELLGGDEEILLEATHRSLVAGRDALEPDEVCLLLVARTLVRDLDVNWPGVEVILRMRTEILDAQRQIRVVFDLLEKAWAAREDLDPSPRTTRKS